MCFKYESVKVMSMDKGQVEDVGERLDSGI